ncbi:hypothetical protein FUAX_02490 [Fulvitalea axinellae]|uniref:Uncharacterized protein n=1 Tax=Fulvitalea axinellae TaxID=1182444 RepID=A0AAU9CLS0_9BACT|nr:hypothetical protein FUAX_02490 [Fulvitalea axinellae]
MRKHIFAVLLVAPLLLWNCSDSDDDGYTPKDSGLNYEMAYQEMVKLMDSYKEDSGKELFDPGAPSKFTEKQNVFMSNAISIKLDHTAPTVTLPVFKGEGADGGEVYYIITEASDYQIAKRMGINYSPKLKYARGSQGVQLVTLNDSGRMKFKGKVDFSPVRRIVPGDGPFAFPPKVAEPGAIGDAEYSPVVVLPSGLVMNATPLKNATGLHDRLPEGQQSIDTDKMEATLQILDGFQNGRAYYYHLVTDAYDNVPATIELGIYAPRLGKIPQFGQSTLDQESALLAFSPVGNGITGEADPMRQGLNSAILSDKNGSGADAPLDPINVFPIEPANHQIDNNYSPLWDAHINRWTDEAIQQNKRRRITSFEDLKSLIKAGWVTSFTPDAGPENPYVGGLHASNAIINCPVIAHPYE